jgi:L-lysine exporter family protein LysE/ArgO
MTDICMAPFLQGCGTGAGLIIAIGAQNAFVLKQGLLKNYVFVSALTCCLADILLIGLGVGGVGQVLVTYDLFMDIARYGGAAFLFWYGLRSFKLVFGQSTLDLSSSPERPDLKTTIITLLAVSLLNPHAYLDAVVLLGSIGAQFPDNERYSFGFGAIIASIVWFFVLAYGARYLTPLFQNPKAWRVLDFIIGCILWFIAISLLIPDDCFCRIG